MSPRLPNVERGLRDLTREALAPDFELDLRAHRRLRHREIADADRHAERRRQRAARELADLLAAAEHRVALARDAFLAEAHADQTPRGALRALAQQRLLAEERGL